jgi:predicted nucleic acid-binding protein
LRRLRLLVRRSRNPRLRILLDTTFLLPIVGVEIEGIRGFLERLWKMYRGGEAEIFYTDLNLLEISWVLAKISYDPVAVMKGLVSIEKNFSRAPVKASSIFKALELRKKGFKDLIDLILYTTALENGLKFATLDKTLIEFIDRAGGDTSVFLTEI